MRLEYKNKEKIFEEKNIDGVEYLSYPLLEKTGIVAHGFSTRIGGVSEGVCSTMNLSFARGDKEEAVRENFRRMAHVLGVEPGDMVCSKQTHTTNVRVVTEEDRGKGITKSLDYTDVDGLITNVPGLCLVTFYADCVPLFFVDDVRHVIGLSHSGWRGTAGKIGIETIKVMKNYFDCRPEHIKAAIGPSICGQCYEISKDVADIFKENFSEKAYDSFMTDKGGGKYMLDLWKANKTVLLEGGLLEKNIAVTDICTCCNSEVMWSHRKTGNARGSLAAFLMLENGDR